MSTRCLSPFYKKDDDTPLPCGSCPNCQARRTSQWSYRLMMEAKELPSLFLTLTYSNDFFLRRSENVSIAEYNRYSILTKNGFLTLRKNAIPLFMKRLRKASRVKLKYYCVGEYGGKTRRPHYHVLLFGLALNSRTIELIENAWSVEGISLGQVHYGEVNGASVGYTLKYMCKPWQMIHARDDRQQQFALMSKGLGSNYLTAPAIRYHRVNLDNYFLTLVDGKKVSMPRYYYERIYTHDDLLGIKQNALLREDLINEHERLQKFLVQTSKFRNYERDTF